MPTATSNGHKIAFTVTGDGPPLLLHPGMFQVGRHWTDAGYTEALATDHTVVTIDPLGLGDSGAPTDPAAYSLPRRAEYVTAVLDEIGADRAVFWGYSLGALTGYAVAIHAPERLTALVAGAFDPITGFRSAVEPMLEHLGLPADTDPYPFMEEGSLHDPSLAAVIRAADPEALRANFTAFSQEPPVGERLAASGVRALLYAGTNDVWHDPMRAYASETGTPFVSLPGADHITAWSDAASALAEVRPFL